MSDNAPRLALSIIPLDENPDFIYDAFNKIQTLAENYPALKIASYDDNNIYFVDDPIAYPNYYEDYLLEISNIINSDYETPFLVAISVIPMSAEDFQYYYGVEQGQAEVDYTVPQEPVAEEFIPDDSFLYDFVPEGYVEPPAPLPITPPWEENPDDYYFQNGQYKRQSEIEANPFYQDCADGSTQQASVGDLIWTGSYYELKEPCWDHGGSLQAMIDEEQAMIDEEGRIAYEQSPSYGESDPVTQDSLIGMQNRAMTYYWLRGEGYDNATALRLLSEWGYA